MERLGKNAVAFSIDINTLAPPSVQLLPAKRYTGAPIGTSYDIRIFTGKFFIYNICIVCCIFFNNKTME